MEDRDRRNHRNMKACWWRTGTLSQTKWQARTTKFVLWLSYTCRIWAPILLCTQRKEVSLSPGETELATQWPEKENLAECLPYKGREVRTIRKSKDEKERQGH